MLRLSREYRVLVCLLSFRNPYLQELIGVYGPKPRLVESSLDVGRGEHILVSGRHHF